MVTLKEIDEVALIEALYLSSFPREERREVAEMSRLVDSEPRYHILGVYNKECLLGFLSFWELGEWTFGEHFAISPSARGNGIGAEVMRQSLSTHPQLILEVEPPTTDIAKRRVAFYERLGFKLWSIPYLQPPYREGDTPTPLRLMTSGVKPTEGLIRTIHEVVYQQKNPAHTL